MRILDPGEHPLLHLRVPAALGRGQRYIEPASLVANGGRGALQSFRNRSNASPRGSQSPQPSFVLRGPGLREPHLPFASAPAQKGGGSSDQNILVRPGSVSMSLDVFSSSGIELLMLSRQPAWLKTQIWRSGVIDKRYRDRKVPQRNLRLNLTGQGYLHRRRIDRVELHQKGCADHRAFRVEHHNAGI